MIIFFVFKVAFVFALASALPAPAKPGSDLVLRTASSITWDVCPPDVLGAPLLRCASFSVPVDWNEPDGEQFDLGLVKLPGATSNSTFHKIGTLFINPGGPGGPASQFVAALALGSIKSDYFLGSFDIVRWCILQQRCSVDNRLQVGLDPRGVGLSNQVQCDSAIYAERVSLFPQTEEELRKLKDKNRRFGESCLNRTGPVFEHLDTIRLVNASLETTQQVFDQNIVLQKTTKPYVSRSAVSPSISLACLTAHNSALNTLICFPTTFVLLHWMVSFHTLNLKPQTFSPKLLPTILFYRTSLSGQAPTSLLLCKAEMLNPSGLSCSLTQAQGRFRQRHATIRIATAQ